METRTFYPETGIERVRRLIEGQSVRYYVLTLGCQQNEADSERIRGMAEAMGYAPAAEPEEASLIIVNTCAIRRHAELKALSIVGRFKAIKTERPETVIGICGCMAAEPHMVEHIKKNFHFVTFTLEPNRLFRLPELVATALMEQRRSFVLGEDDGRIAEGLPIRRTSDHRAYVSIMYGCNNFCSYCIVPYVRGRERSRESAAVLAECRALIENGVKEITLLGQNVNSYCSDMSFAALISAIAQMEGDFLIRFMTSHPKDVSDELIAAMKKYKGKIAPCFHLPLQAGSDRILKAMNRTYNTEHYLSIAKKLREAVPEIVLTTDIIVAFPGETEEDFLGTLKIVEEVGFDMIFSFIFSPREGTKAAKMENTITEEEKNDRMARLLAMQKEIALKKNLPYLDRTERVLVDDNAREGEGNYIGRTAGGKLVRFTDTKNRIGEFISVKITKATPFDLFGEAVD
ncbi:MAG: tRNA (N6-isopentenyl adenosine(37)-C2)-methylthiotransferase MiaB [Clostridia bacterium]|nr:tRNA (N6-isopentenyl adenosine(37)-C2)-methylthiotransferase MiaB [Clostridia bacterium]